MEGSPMIIMWSNADSSITLSQRKATQHLQPTVDHLPDRLAIVEPSSSLVKEIIREVFSASY